MPFSKCLFAALSLTAFQVFAQNQDVVQKIKSLDEERISISNQLEANRKQLAGIVDHRRLLAMLNHWSAQPGCAFRVSEGNDLTVSINNNESKTFDFVFPASSLKGETVVSVHTENVTLQGFIETAEHLYSVRVQLDKDAKIYSVSFNQSLNLQDSSSKQVFDIKCAQPN